MFKKKKRYELQNVYRTNPESKAYIIEVSLDDYEELFNGWDASILKQKELEPELMDYLLSASYEIPFKNRIELWFFLPEAMIDESKEVLSVQGIVNNFKMKRHFIELLLHRNYRKIFTYIIISAIFLLFAYSLPNVIELNVLFSILMEGFFIGGWVLLWEAFSLFFFTSHDTRLDKKQYVRLMNSKIYFKIKKL
jgi:hypothetical protein